MKSQCLMKIVKCLSAATFVSVALTPGTAGATHPTVGLGTADSFAVLAGSTVTNTNPTVVNGDLGVSPGNAVTGFPPGIVNGTRHEGDAVAAQAQSDLTTAYNDAAGRFCNADLSGQDLGGLTLTAGVYCYSSSAQLTGTLTLDAQGNPFSVFIFKIASTLTTASNSNVALINSSEACNVFWQVGSSATLGTTTQFRGNILALTSITANTGARVQDGRLLARTGAVTLDNNIITRPTCSHPVVQSSPPAGGTPTGGTTTGGTTGGTTGNTSSGRQRSGTTPDNDLPQTGERFPTAPTLALGTFMILAGFLYNFLGTSSSPLALAVRGYQPKRRARPWRKV